MEIAHLSDIHIRNYHYHDVYKSVFGDLYEELKEREPDEIFVTGDLAHTKTSLSPEYFKMATEFLSELADITTTRVFIGNHDCNIRNKHREDAIRPVVEAVDIDDLYYHKFSETVSLTEDHQLYHLSIFDKDWDNLPEIRNKTSIAVFHGPVKGAKTDLGWVMKEGEISEEKLKEYDFGLLGDIHRTNQSIDKDDKFKYPGSLIQQNHGEEMGKGFLYWDIEDSDNFSVEHVELENPKPFFTVELDDDGDFDKSVVPENCRLRIKRAGSGYKEAKEAIEYAKKECDVHSVSCMRGGSDSTVGQDLDTEESWDFSNRDVQEKFIKEYFEDDDEINEDHIEKIIEHNKKYDEKIEDDKVLDIDWSLKELEWNRLFNFGEGNKIDFTSKSGIIGIFGENYSGKSSVVDSFLYTLFNNTGKDLRKSRFAVNKDFKKGSGKVVLERGGVEYYIERETRKVYDTSQTSNDFYRKSGGKEVSLNESGRVKTDKKIRSMFGSYEDFKRTSFISQIDSLEFISETSTKRKKILSNFLNLESFRKKYDLASDDISMLRGELKQHKGDNPSERLEELREDLRACEKNTEEAEETLEEWEEELSGLREECAEVKDEIDSVPAEPIDIDDLRQKLRQNEESLESERDRKERLEKKIEGFKEDLEETNEILDTINKSEIEESLEEYRELDEKYNELLERLRKKKKKREEIEEYSSYLEDPPCNPEYTDCQLVQEAHEKIEKLEEVQEDVEDLESDKESLLDKLSTYDVGSLKEDEEKYEELEEQASQLSSRKTNFSLKLEKCKSKIDDLEDEREDLLAKKKKYEENREAIENLEDLTEEKEALEGKIKRTETKIEKKESEIREFYKEHGFIEQEIENVKDKKEELSELRFEYETLDKYRDAMHSNGIPFEIIKRKLSIINEEISEIISGFFDFDIFFEHDDGDLDIYISHQDEDPRPIELGSGAEKTVASIVIRMALLNVSATPKGDVFILDEPATELDSDNLQSFVNILDLIKSQFRVVILISHLESLKDCVDDVLTIDEKDGYAHLEA